MILSKDQIFSACMDILEKKIRDLREAYNSVSEAAHSETKSSAGDKYETSRAMMQLEQEKLSKQLAEALAQKKELEAIDLSRPHTCIGKGTLVKTDRAWLFLGPALGRITAGDQTVIAVSAQSPLGKKLTGRKKHGHVEVNGQKYFIEEIF